MKFLTIILLSLLAVACGKNVDTKNPTPKHPPIANPGIVVGQPLPGISGQYTVEFSNHNSGEVGDNRANYSQYVFAENMDIQLPSFLNVEFITTSYDFFYQGQLTVVINNTEICSYDVYSSSKLILENGCDGLPIQIQAGDKMWISGISPHWNVELKFIYEK